jgi:Holliday junction resolvase-like predicted endonuclease
MTTDIGEFIVGAYLKAKLECDVVDYNVRPPGGGLEGLGELDVIGLDFTTSTAYLCEVTTHIRGLLYKNNRETVARITKKHERQKWYAQLYLSNFEVIRYMFWSPVVPVGAVTEGLSQLPELELIINVNYTEKVRELEALAKDSTHDAGNPFFRMLQIMTHLRE